MYDSALAVLSDIHGNRWSLEAVLEDIDRRGVRDLVNLGDCVYGPLDPMGTADILVDLGIPTVRGNEDRFIVDGSSAEGYPTLQFVRDNLRSDHKEWLSSLELNKSIRDTFSLCHGTPTKDDEYLLNKVMQSGVELRESTELESYTTSTVSPVLLCGHDHLPRTVRLPNNKLIVNPGSVGLPAYSDDAPFPHVMQAGTPHARYSILIPHDRDWVVQDIAVPYDWETASKTALGLDRPDWALWLRTGRANIE